MNIDPKRVKEIFLEAAELPDEAVRAAYLDKACGADAGMRERVEALLRAHDPEGSFLGTPAAVVPDADHAATCGLAPAPNQAAARTSDGGAGASDDESLTFLAPSTRPDALGRLGHYEVLQVLGRGGFGIVFRAFDEMLQRVVALKVMAPQLAATSPARKRFLREARSSAQVRHENVVQVYEIAEQPLPYLAMEFIPGETLQQKLDRVGPLEVPEVLRIGRQIAEGLAAAHATDLIHRDIKPGNVLLEGGQHKVKITDFGLARTADDASISQSGIIAGTPMYMAPEQAQGQTLDQRADLFSLGSVLYQMVAGRPPFRANSAVAVLKRVAEDRPRAIREIIPETPQWLCDLIAKLHAKHPDDRYQSAREVADVLADCEAQLKAHAKVQDFSRIPQSKPVAGASGRWKWVAAAALLLPVVALALTESAGITHLLPKQQPTPDLLQSGDQSKDNGPSTEFTNTLGMKFKLIPAGKFTMGSPKEEIDRCLKQLEGAELWVKKTLATEGPEHLVEITQPFYLGATEVTVGQFRQFVDEQGYQVGDGRWRNPGFDQTDQHPMVWVSWNNAVDFCKWLSKKEGKEYRLPTEAEWEYSCRAGKAGSRYCFGGDDAQLEEYAWYATNSGVGQHPGAGTHPVGKKKPNAWGLYGMHGNAWEWCQDNYDPDYYKNSPVKDPPGPSAGGGRVARGGSWPYGPVYCRSAFRGYIAPNFRGGWGGFRVLLVSPPAGVGTESGTKNKPASQAIAPFTAAQARAHQEAWAKDLGVPVQFTNRIGMKLQLIPPGRFTMGSSKEEIDFWLKQTDSGWVRTRLDGEGPQHEVEITQPLYLGQTEVTVGQFRQFVTAQGYKTQAERDGGAYRHPPIVARNLEADTSWLNPGFAQTDDHPVVCVNWNDAVEFCNWLSKQEGKSYRLSTEAEWEYGCRAGSRGRWCFGDNEGELLKYARIGGNSQGHTWPVAGLSANVWGLHDMYGNVWEWCQDVYDANYYQTSPPKDPPGPGAGLTRVARGGSWLDASLFGRSACRSQIHFRESHNNVGFRVVLAVSPPAGVPNKSGAKDKPSSPAIAPFTDADVQRIAALPAAQQVEEVRKELMRRNKGFDGTLTPTIQDDAFIGLAFLTDQVTDIAPVRALARLQKLDIHGPDYDKAVLADLSPLKGMPLKWLNIGENKVSDLTPLTGMPLEWLAMWQFRGADLTPLKNMPLKWLNCGGGGQKLDLKPLAGLPLEFLCVNHTQVSDLTPLKDAPLTDLECAHTQVSDLSPLKGIRLTRLLCYNTPLSDLSPLQDMPLQEIRMTPKNLTKGLDTLRGMKSLKTIGIENPDNQVWPAAEFWQRYDKGEFKK